MNNQQMKILASFFSITSWVLLLVLFICSLLVAIYDHRKLTNELAKATKAKKRGIMLRRALVWSVPAISLLLTFSARLTSVELQNRVEEIRLKTGPRSITKEQERILLETLKPASDDPVLVWWSPSKTVEHQQYAENLANTLLKAGFVVECKDLPGQTFPDGEEGVLVEYADRGLVAENARRIRSGFTLAGIEARFEKVTEFPKGEIGLQIVILGRPIK